MEKFSSFERVVGKISEETREQILKSKAEQFDNQIFEELKGKEREKTLEELEIISLANEITNEVRKRYGLDNFNVPAKNIHVIKADKWPKEKVTTPAVYNTTFEGVVMQEHPSRIVFMNRALHEMLHFKSYKALQITDEKNSLLVDYRVGLTINARNGKKRYFTNLNEAVTEEITRRCFSKLSDKPVLIREIKQTKEIKEKYPDAITNSGEPLFNGDTIYAEVEGKKTWSEIVGNFFGKGEKSKRISTERYSYLKERGILNVLIDKLFEKNKEDFHNREEIFELFAKGMVSGNVLPIGRLIDTTFGKGTLRKIGELDNQIDEQEKIIRSL